MPIIVTKSGKRVNKWQQLTAKSVTCFAKKPAKQAPILSAAVPDVIHQGESMPNPQIDSFPPEVAERLQYYVYRLIDPRNGETFYVGTVANSRW